MNTPNMYILTLSADEWAEVYANRRIHEWADEIYDLEWVDPDDGTLKARGTSLDWSNIAATDAGSGFAGATAGFDANLQHWMKRFR